MQDAILARGKELTEEQHAKLKKNVNLTNMNFTSDGFRINEFEGKDYSAVMLPSVSLRFA